MYLLSNTSENGLTPKPPIINRSRKMESRRITQYEQLLLILEARKYDLNECLIWFGNKDKDGYGKVRVGNSQKKVHRLALGWKHDRELTKTELACHSCDNPSCYNPYHLWVGTSASNNQDMYAKGRTSTIGETHHKTHLGEADVLYIKYSVLPRPELANMYNITVTAVGYIQNGRNWKSLNQKDRNHARLS